MVLATCVLNREYVITNYTYIIENSLMYTACLNYLVLQNDHLLCTLLYCYLMNSLIGNQQLPVISTMQQ